MSHDHYPYSDSIGCLICEKEKAKGAVIDPDMLDRIGVLRDMADNALHATKMKLPPHIHIEGLTGCLEHIKKEADAIYKALGGTE